MRRPLACFCSAVDSLALQRFPDHESPKKSLAAVLPRLLQLSRDARAEGETLLPAELWYAHYLNPFQLLNVPECMDLEKFDAKTLQKLRKAMLQEIELEDGALPWMPGVVIDRSRAISACEELNDEAKRFFHWCVFNNKPLLIFLGIGGHEHFLVDEAVSPLDTFELLEDEESGFREWLSEPFTKQYETVLSKAIERRNLVVLECLLDGRRWVSPSHADRCFENARRLVERALFPLLDAGERAAKEKPSVAALRAVLDGNSLVGLLNLLPTYFRDHQNKAVAAVRDIAVTCFNKHGDGDLSQDILQLTKLFRFKSVNLNQQLDEDFTKIDELIREERRHEARKSMASESWAITKEGARKGEQFIRAEEVTALRWGVMISRESSGLWYDYVIAAADPRKELAFTWRTKDQEANQEHFGDLVNAALNYLLPNVAKAMENRLAAGQAVHIGPCRLSSSGITFNTKGWIFEKSHSVQWQQVRMRMENGDVIVSDVKNSKAKVALSARNVANAVVLSFLIYRKSAQ